MSDPRLEALYQSQFEIGGGLLVTAFTYDTAVRVRHAATDPRWPTRPRSFVDGDQARDGRGLTRG